ncbi:YqaA family protein [Jiella sp. M17.18]|uniref:YqaA family protein n=1 Tax=Jiella sp. M17.18 TaxID=3234247 RepID=UPI0034DFDF1A
MADALATYGGLALSSFLAATLLPGTSEALLSALLVSGRGDPLLLVLAATAGNVAGSLFNWLCGRSLIRFLDRRWFPVSRASYDKAVRWYRRFGLWSLLFAWAPIVGDPLTVVAGTLRTPLPAFTLLVTVEKLARYAAIAGVALWWTG